MPISSTSFIDNGAVVRRAVGDKSFGLLIDGELSGAADGATLTTVDPSTGADIVTVPAAGPADVERAVAAAQRAQPAWEASGLAGRRDAFAALEAVIAEHADELAMLDAIDSGNPLPAALADVRSTLLRIRDWPGLALSITGATYPASAHNVHYSAHRPYGVVGRIIPFNHPAVFAIGKVLIPLIAGNTVVLKAAEQTPLSALRFGELAREVFPPGVLNVLSGGATPGDAIARHPAVKRIAFTGSVATAMKLSQSAAGVAIKHLSLELGGKNAFIAFPDADLDAVVAGAVDGMNFALSQGQSCGSTSRVFVHDSVHDAFCEQVAARLAQLRIGRAYDAGVDMGPLVSAAQLQRVTGYVDTGLAQGARLVCGGGRPPGVPDGGSFLEPTVFADVTCDMAIAREEIFGPVMSVLRWNDYETVIAQANDTDLGLTASVWTNDLSLAHHTAERLHAGYVWINTTRTHFWGTPFGGFKNSGLGREESIDELLSYYETQVVHTILRDPETALAGLTAAPGGRP